MKLVLACPTYGPTEPRFNRALRSAIMHAANNGHQWLGDASPDKQPFAAARNNVVQSVIHNEAYGDDTLIVWSDSDIIWPLDGITTLAHRGLDFITGIYFQKQGHHWPLIAHFNGKSFQWAAKWPQNAVAPIDGCGFGCCVTSFRMLRKMTAPWFEYVKFSEDFDFCLKATKAGFQLHVDTSVVCKHLHEPQEIGIDHFWAKHPEFRVEGSDNGTVRSNAEVRNVADDEGCEDRPAGQGVLAPAQVQLG